MRETELKAVVPDADALRASLRAAGAECTFSGTLTDRRFDTPALTLTTRDHALRIRTAAPAGGGARTSLDWKGATVRDAGYKVREERSVVVADEAPLTAILEALGYTCVGGIERTIEEYAIGGASVRIEWYPRLDVLVEVEGAPDAIERAIAATGMAREAFGAESLPRFVEAFEARTGTRAALSARELTDPLGAARNVSRGRSRDA